MSPRPLLLAALLLAGLAAEDKPAAIRIAAGGGGGTSPFAGGVLGYVGEHRLLEEEFARDGIPVTWAIIKGNGPGVNEALANGSLDFAGYGDFPAIIARAGGVRTRILLNYNRGANSYLVVPTGSTATGIRDLVGKRISLNKGRPFELAFDRLLESEGLRQADFRIFNLTPNDGQAAIAAGSVDAHFGNDALIFESTGSGRVIWSTRDRDPHYKWTSEIFVTDDFATRYPVATQRVVNVLLRVYHRYALEENREEYLRSLARAGQPYEVQVREYEGVSLRARTNPLIDPFLMEHYRRAAALARSRGLIRREVADVEGWFDRRFLDAGLKELGLEGFWTPVAADGSNLGLE
jgi:sulfonate transport system substrate-binding protein